MEMLPIQPARVALDINTLDELKTGGVNGIKQLTQSQRTALNEAINTFTQGGEAYISEEIHNTITAPGKYELSILNTISKVFRKIFTRNYIDAATLNTRINSVYQTEMHKLNELKEQQPKFKHAEEAFEKKQTVRSARVLGVKSYDERFAKIMNNDGDSGQKVEELQRQRASLERLTHIYNQWNDPTATQLKEVLEKFDTAISSLSADTTFFVNMNNYLSEHIIKADVPASEKLERLTAFKEHLEKNSTNKADPAYKKLLEGCKTESNALRIIEGLGRSEERHMRDMQIAGTMLSLIIQYEKEQGREVDSLITEMQESYAKLGEIVPSLAAAFKAANSREGLAVAYQPSNFASYIEHMTKITNNYEFLTPKVRALWDNNTELKTKVDEEFNKQIAKHAIQANNLFDLTIAAVQRLPKHPGEIGVVAKSSPEGAAKTQLEEEMAFFSDALLKMNDKRRVLDNKLEPGQAKFKALSSLLANFDKNTILFLGSDGNFAVQEKGIFSRFQSPSRSTFEATGAAFYQLARVLEDKELAKRLGENEIKALASKFYYNLDSDIRARVESSPSLNALIPMRERLRQSQI